MEKMEKKIKNESFLMLSREHFQNDKKSYITFRKKIEIVKLNIVIIEPC